MSSVQKKSVARPAKPPNPEVEARKSAENEGMPPRVSVPSAAAAQASALEGEGSRTAARRYEKGVKHSIEQGTTKELAEEASLALDGPEAAALREAEQVARLGRAGQAARRLPG